MASREPWREAAVEAGRAVVSRRVELGYRTRAQFADDVGLTPKTLGEIERGARPSYSPSTYAALDQALQWAAGTLEALLAGNPHSDHSSTQPPAPVDIGPELATIDGLAMWMRQDSFPYGYLLHHAGLDEQARMRVVDRQRERNDRQLLENLDAEAADIVAEGGRLRPEAWPPWLVDRFGWKVPDDNVTGDSND